MHISAKYAIIDPIEEQEHYFLRFKYECYRKNQEQAQLSRNI